MRTHSLEIIILLMVTDYKYYNNSQYRAKKTYGWGYFDTFAVVKILHSVNLCLF